MKQFYQSSFLVAMLLSNGIQSFSSVPTFTRRTAPTSQVKVVAAEDDLMDDQTLLQTVEESQLQDLCRQCHLDSTGTKTEMLMRLRAFAAHQAEVERQVKIDRVTRVEDGDDGSKQTYQIVNEEPDEDDVDDGGFFYFELPALDDAGTAALAKLKARQNQNRDESGTNLPKPAYLDKNTVITAPPVPDHLEPDENGERVVTVYNTQEQNDLTGVVAAQPNAAQYSNDILMNGPGNAPQPWEVSTKSATSAAELKQAKERVAELVHSLLAMTGAPAFKEEYSEGVQMYSENKSRSTSPQGFVGFDPSKFQTDVLTRSSRDLRAGRGQVLDEILRDYELRAVGHDGMAGDNIEKGGGHFREVSKVRAFLEGFRKAEVRRVARETTTMLLDKLATEGVEGLDFMLASMTKTSDETGEAGELNDALVKYLGDAIRQQERKVAQMFKEDEAIIPEIDMTANLWNVTEENGQRFETLDPSNPVYQRVMEEEIQKTKGGSLANNIRSKRAPEQLLVLLKLLRDRIKAEAAFANDEKGRNLRILAYCLNFESDEDRKRLLLKEMKNSMERIESFAELVSNSIDYAESTSHLLQPSKASRPLDIALLKRIYKMAKDIRDDQAYRASGIA